MIGLLAVALCGIAAGLLLVSVRAVRPAPRVRMRHVDGVWRIERGPYL